MIEKLIWEQGQLRRTIDSLQDKVAELTVPRQAPPLASPRPQVECGAPAMSSTETPLESMMRRLEDMEKMVREDAGKEKREVQTEPLPPEERVPIRDDPEECLGDGDVKRRKMDSTVSQLLRSMESPQAAYLRHVKDYQELPTASWPMPEGYKERLAPTYHILGSFTRRARESSMRRGGSKLTTCSGTLQRRRWSRLWMQWTTCSLANPVGF